MIGILVSCLVVAIVAYVIFLVLKMIPLPEPIKQIVLIIAGLIIVVWLLNILGLYHMNLNMLPGK